MVRFLTAILAAAGLGGCCTTCATAPFDPVAVRCPVSADAPPAGAHVRVERISCGPAATRDCLAKLRDAACDSGASGLYAVHPERTTGGTDLVASVAWTAAG